LQKSIATQASKSVKEKGYFLYITCSVFEKENEEVVAFIQDNTSLEFVSSHYFIGYDKRADTLFAALFECTE
jgi:16S rRNA (cytosine967-C5)-methyltransferase